MPKLSVSAEPADWKEYDIYVNDEVAKATHSFDAAAKSKNKYY